MANSNMPLDIDLPISAAELDYAEAKFQAEKRDDTVSEQTHLLYAWSLIRSLYRSDRAQGVQEFENLLRKFPERRRDYLYYLASGNYKLGDFKKALSQIDELLRIEPENEQFIGLKGKVSKKLQKDGAIGFALVGACAALTAGFVIAAYRSKK